MDVVTKPQAILSSPAEHIPMANRLQHRTKRSPNRAVKSAALALVAIFLLFNVASAIYTVVTGEYNGDFYGVAVDLSLSSQLTLFVASCLPFFVLWRFFLQIEQQRPGRQIEIPLRFLKVFVPLLLLLQIYVTLQFQVGVIGQPAYQITGPMKLFVLLINRFQPFYIGTFFLLVLPRRSWLELLTIALLIWVGLLRAGLGAFLYVGLALILKYHTEIAAFARRRHIVILLGLCVVPLIVTNLYDLRNTLRQDEGFADYSVATLVTGLFLGRISSFSNSMVVVENTDYFAQAANTLDTLYFQKQMIGGVLGAGFMPSSTPQSLLINVSGGDIENYSYMTGLIGDLNIAAHQGLIYALLNVLSVCLIIFATVWVAKAFRFPQSGAFGLMLLLYPTMSGVASEYSAVLYFFVVLALLLGSVNALNRLRKPRRRRVGGRLSAHALSNVPALRQGA